MKYFLIFLVLIWSSSLIIPQIFADSDYTEFIIDGYTITTNSNSVEDISLDWDSKYLPEGTVTFNEPFTGTLEIQIPKSMPRTMNLDFETSLFLIVDSAVDSQYDDKITETESECFYILSMNLENVGYFEIVTGSVATGRWEPVTINNQKCNNIDNDFEQQINEKLTLKEQLSDKIDWDDIRCPNTQHVLTERPNGKIACVYPPTVEKLNWEIINPDSTLTPSVFEVVKDNVTFDIEYEIKGGSVEDMAYDEGANSLVIQLTSDKPEKLSVKVDKEILEYASEECPGNIEYPDWAKHMVLINGVEVEYDERISNEKYLYLEIQVDLSNQTLKEYALLATQIHAMYDIPYHSNSKIIEIIGICVI